MRLAWVLVLAGSMAVHGFGVQAQWQLQETHSTASLRGVASVGGGVAWASGSGGTVLKTEDGGQHWTKCAVPEGAEKLDFRGVQAFDAKTAIVMSSGTGDLSRIYKTVDGGATWKLLYLHPDKDGFWDSIKFEDRQTGYLLGDPTGGSFWLATTNDGGEHWIRQTGKALAATHDMQGAYAASNTSLANGKMLLAFASGGLGGSFVYAQGAGETCVDDCSDGKRDQWSKVMVPVGPKTASGGIFGISTRDPLHWMAIGGDYRKPDETAGVAAWSEDGGKTWTLSATQPHGFRSAAAYDPKAQVWITVGPNGTDLSADDGRTWKPLKPAEGGAGDEDGKWNSLSLPFVVGSKGRIGILRSEALAK